MEIALYSSPQRCLHFIQFILSYNYNNCLNIIKLSFYRIMCYSLLEAIRLFTDIEKLYLTYIVCSSLQMRLGKILCIASVSLPDCKDALYALWRSATSEPLSQLYHFMICSLFIKQSRRTMKENQKILDAADSKPIGG